jgi:hypothetical protein
MASDKELQLENAESHTSFTLFGMEIDRKPLCLKAPAPIEYKELGNSIDSSRLQYAKALSSMEYTLFPITTRDRLEHLLKAPYPM